MSLGPASRAFSGRAVIAMLALPALAAVLAAVCLVSFRVGPVPIATGDIIRALINPAAADPRDAAIVWSVRLPRTAMAMLCGGALAVSGAIMQGLFRNALADPGLTGVSSGAAFAAVATIVIGQNRFGPEAMRFLPVAAFLGGLAVTALLYAIASRSGRTSVTVMLLGGIALGAAAMAATGLLIFISSEQQLRELTFWTMGSIAGATWAKIASLALFVGVAAAALPFLTRSLDRLTLGEQEARHMGVDVERTKIIAIVVTALLTGAAVAVSGVIGFLGLVVPHMLRIAVGPAHGLLLPLSGLLGATLLLLADVIARTIVAPAELPVGIVTACLGAPVFLWLLLRMVPGDAA